MKPRLLTLRSDMMGISSKFAIVMGVSFSQAGREVEKSWKVDAVDKYRKVDNPHP